MTKKKQPRVHQREMARYHRTYEPATETKTFWLSFTDSDRPVGQQFLGVAIVDVTPADVDDALIDVMLRFPLAEPGAEWIAAAAKVAWREGCNPGGAMASAEVPLDQVPKGATLVRNKLLQKDDLKALGLIAK